MVGRIRGGTAAQLALGALITAAACCLDLLGLGEPGFGFNQVVALVMGLLLMVTAGGPRRWLAGYLEASPSISPVDCLAWSLCVGLCTGFLEVLQLSVRHQWTGFIIRQSDLIVSMAPLTYLLLFGLLGALLAFGVVAAPRLVTVPTVVFTLVAFAIWNQLSHYLRLDWFAVAAISLGAAIQTARVVTSRAGAWVRRGRRVTPWVLGAFVVAAAGVQVTRAVEERMTLSALPPASPGAPNVVLIVLDTVRADHLGCYGYGRSTTPNIDALAGSGVLFERLVSTSPWTLPAHATLFTGTYPEEHGANWVKPLDARYPTLAEVLSESGYATAGFVGNLGYCSRAWGLARGFARYEDYGYSLGVLASFNPTGRLLVKGANHVDLVRRDAESVTTRFLDWLPSAGDRPFFGFLNYYDAHELYRAPAPFAGKFGPARLDPGRWEQRDRSAAEIAELKNGYDACIAYIDDQIGRIVAALQAREQFENTVFIVTGDHGEHFGEHGLFGHGNSLYWPLIHLPLVMRLPGGEGAGLRVDEFVSLRDLPATILQLVGAPADHPIPGATLAPTWGRPGPTELSAVRSAVSRGVRTPPWEPISRGSMTSVVEQGVQVITSGDGQVERYDLLRDPQQRRDLNGK